MDLLYSAEDVLALPDVWPCWAINLVNIPLRVVDCVNPAFLLKHKATVVVVVLRRPTLAGLPGDRKGSVVDTVTTVELQSRLVGGNVELNP